MAHGAGRRSAGAHGGARGAVRGPGALAGDAAARPRPRPKSNFLILKQHKQHKCRSKLSARFAVDWCVALGGGSKKSSRTFGAGPG